ncbi:MAG: hypothetical protein KC422_26235 [Trueperaceae bacterium]|nr:hypothetical protein [Trueperaceae bacterium]
MHCKEFKTRYQGLDATDSATMMQCLEHVQDCKPCLSYMSQVDLELKGIDLSAYPCIHMANYASFRCEHHPNLKDCSDATILYDARFDEYSLNSARAWVVPIQYCPFCGSELPESKRDRWFKELAALGYDNPRQQAIPEKYKSDLWYRTP